MDAIAHPPGGDGEHPPELSAPEHADDGAREHRLRQGTVSPITRCVCSARNCSRRRASSAPLGGEDRDGEERRVDRAGLPDGEGRDGHAAGHLHDRQQRIEAFQGGALDRHAEDRQRRVGGGHAGQVRGAARARDQDLQAPARRGRGVLGHPARGAVGRDDPALVGDAELDQRFRGVPHGLPVRLAAHDDADEGAFHRGSLTPGVPGRARGDPLRPIGDKIWSAKGFNEKGGLGRGGDCGRRGGRLGLRRPRAPGKRQRRARAAPRDRGRSDARPRVLARRPRRDARPR